MNPYIPTIFDPLAHGLFWASESPSAQSQWDRQRQKHLRVNTVVRKALLEPGLLEGRNRVWADTVDGMTALGWTATHVWGLTRTDTMSWPIDDPAATEHSHGYALTARMTVAIGSGISPQMTLHFADAGPVDYDGTLSEYLANVRLAPSDCVHAEGQALPWQQSGRVKRVAHAMRAQMFALLEAKLIVCEPERYHVHLRDATAMASVVTRLYSPADLDRGKLPVVSGTLQHWNEETERWEEHQPSAVRLTSDGRVKICNWVVDVILAGQWAFLSTGSGRKFRIPREDYDRLLEKGREACPATA